jgi:hypothetical protein
MRLAEQEAADMRTCAARDVEALRHELSIGRTRIAWWLSWSAMTPSWQSASSPAS